MNGATAQPINQAHCCACAAEEERHADRATTIQSATDIVIHGYPGELREAAEEHLMMLFKLPSYK